MIKVFYIAHTHHIEPFITFSLRLKHTPFIILLSPQDDDLYVYKVGEPHTHLPDYPKTVENELGIKGPIDAAFVCQDHHIAHIIQGKDTDNI